MLSVQMLLPWNYQTQGHSTRVPWVHPGDYYLETNFGELEFDWAAGAESVAVRVLDATSGAVVIDHTYPLATLDMGGDPSSGEEPMGHRPRCQPHRGRPSALRSALGWLTNAAVVLLLVLAKPAAIVTLLAVLRSLLSRPRVPLQGPKED